MASLLRPDIPDHVADTVRSLHPDLKRSIRAAIDEIAANPQCGEALRGELESYRKYKVRRFRIIYSIDAKKRIVRILAVAHRRTVYEDFAAELKKRR